MSDPTPNTTRCPRWVKILLSLSLAANLAIVGVVAGFLMRAAPMRNGPTGMGYAAPYVIALPREARREIFDAIRSDDALPKRSARRAHYSEMIEALRADPFDRSRVEAILTRQSNGVAQIQDVSQVVWLSAVAEMDAAERATYVERVEDVLKRGKRGKKGDRK